ncbi:unnamed protein product [Linum trigynum]|uniref:Replication protein A 70 kDa DNA-binding subunit B/D first OB fold domain-containing protein n=1 Tax=Linum trigynum TaxID=586398 RepID=A0AAV2DB61_9ROSI
MEDHTIDRLSTENENENGTVLARVSKKWQTININSNVVRHLDLILIDTKGRDIHVQIPRSFMNNFERQIKEQDVYTFRNFRVKEATGEFRPIKEPLVIVFKRTTKIQPTNTMVNIQKYKFDFFLEEQIDKLKGKK